MKLTYRVLHGFNITPFLNPAATSQRGTNSALNSFMGAAVISLRHGSFQVF